jgi:hypothetical protein
MTIRPFDWRDLRILYRYRQHGIFLDSALALTRGSMLVPLGALLSYFAPATGIFTYLCEQSDHREAPLLGQVKHSSGSSSARLSFLAPESMLESASLPTLLDQVAYQIGMRGAFHVLAEVNDGCNAFEALRQAGFAIYARQHIWVLRGVAEGEPKQTGWCVCEEGDLSGVLMLYNDLVPGLVQQIEPPPKDRGRGLVYRQDGEVKAYVELKYGMRGIWVQPYVHPDIEGFAGRLANLVESLPNRRSRPVYVCVRSYQSWLESAVQETGAETFVRQAVMVRHLAITKKAAEAYKLPAINGTQAEPTAPFARIKVVNKETNDR